MIEKMKKVAIIVQSSRKKELLDMLQNLGVLHISSKKEADAVLAERFAALSKISFELKAYSKGSERKETVLSDAEFERIFQDTQELLFRKNHLLEKRTDLMMEMEKIKPWGDFDPADIRDLKQKGFDFHFYRLEKKEFKAIAQREDIAFFRLAPVEKRITIAVLGSLDDSVSAVELVIPEMGLSQMEAAVRATNLEIEHCEAELRDKAAFRDAFHQQLIKIQNDVEYSSVSRTVEGDDALIWITGYIPQSEEQRFLSAAKENSWAWAMEDVIEDDGSVPTKIRYNKLTALVEPVMDILGTVPGYAEYDISFWFLAFFTLFFAMIIGDAGYGALLLLGTAVVAVKMRKVNNAILLLFVLSVATMVWGAITGTWFGLESAMEVPFLKALVIPGFANYPEYFSVETTTVQNNVMRFSFTIGVIQLALACIMNIRKKINQKNLSWIADLGWLASICALYALVLYLVIGQSINIVFAAATVITGFVLVLLFGGMSPEKTFAQGLKAGLSGAFTVFLDTISAFGNVMSYIRLFAVGMASLAIAQSFNNMGAGFDGVLVIVGFIIMLFGHALNIVMGFLSVAVHGVRLNLLEFSGQLGMEWTGKAYEPFKKRNQLKEKI